MYINFADFAGRPISFWDWSALCSCCENCDLFQMTIEEAVELRLCSPCFDGCNAKEKKLILSMKLVEVGSMQLDGRWLIAAVLQVARIIRGIRNPMQHYNILDMEFPHKFAAVHTACRALGGDVQLAIRLLDSSRQLFPAKNSLEEVTGAVQVACCSLSVCRWSDMSRRRLRAQRWCCLMSSATSCSGW